MRRKPLILRPGKMVGGYLFVNLYQAAKVKTPVTVHRLVLEAFVGPRPDGMECRHLDGDPANNRLANLAWGSPVENASDRKRHQVERRTA